uniref:AlNc14C55G4190 protein n=1 Tax=Albugo laibachii Nc14 TaxID=890382 RepID=F0WC03_9STRA|nr:AlNc14C55G4190 [Albugo laibachii Nc14]|eukprot:CCA18684.1 AlNc14C55G4190 [Albugo laibachii Nc14]
MICVWLRTALRKAAYSSNVQYGGITTRYNRSLYINLRDNRELVRANGRLQRYITDDKLMSENHVIMHEKKWQRRRRKAGEQLIRHANARLGKAISFFIERRNGIIE